MIPVENDVRELKKTIVDFSEMLLSDEINENILKLGNLSVEKSKFDSNKDFEKISNINKEILNLREEILNQNKRIQEIRLSKI